MAKKLLILLFLIVMSGCSSLLDKNEKKLGKYLENRKKEINKNQKELEGQEKRSNNYYFDGILDI